MFGGHYGPSYALKTARPGLSLGLLFLLTQLPDLLWSALHLLGIERSEPVRDPHTGRRRLRFVTASYSHSLAATLAWAALAYAGARWLLPGPRPERQRDALLVAGTVGSHWLLDAVVMPPELPLWGNSAKVGLDLQRHRPAALLAEAALLLGPLVWYARRTSSDGTLVGGYGMAMLGALQLLFTAIGSFTPPPETMRTTAASGLGVFLTFAALGEWLSRKRIVP
ncbi:MAG TPA: hypothetical protein VHS99_21995 [Chloroflexota bacterium]|nr:hypothetical protein [Chloroflexota bacterium]